MSHIIEARNEARADSSWHNPMFTREQVAAFNKSPPTIEIKALEGNPYLGGEYIIGALNNLVGQGFWSSEAHISDITKELVTKPAKNNKSAYDSRFVAVTIETTLTIHSAFGNGKTLTFRECTTGTAEAPATQNVGNAIDNAAKGATTDGIKRCAKMLGPVFGLDIKGKIMELPVLPKKPRLAAIAAPADAQIVHKIRPQTQDDSLLTSVPEAAASVVEATDPPAVEPVAAAAAAVAVAVATSDAVTASTATPATAPVVADLPVTVVIAEPSTHAGLDHQVVTTGDDAAPTASEPTPTVVETPAVPATAAKTPVASKVAPTSEPAPAVAAAPAAAPTAAAPAVAAAVAPAATAAPATVAADNVEVEWNIDNIPDKAEHIRPFVTAIMKRIRATTNDREMATLFRTKSRQFKSIPQIVGIQGIPDQPFLELIHAKIDQQYKRLGSEQTAALHLGGIKPNVPDYIVPSGF